MAAVQILQIKFRGTLAGAKHLFLFCGSHTLSLMRAWQVSKWSEPEEMILAEVPPPTPGPGQIRIRNRAAALNFFDILQIQGKYQIKPPFPFTPGAEIAGEIDAVGEGVTAWRVGDRVLG